MREPLIEFVDVSFRYPTSRSPLFEGLNLRVSVGEVLCLLGESGSGKSSLLRLFAGLETPSSGTIRRGVHPVGGFVFQTPVLLDWLTVEQNIVFPIRVRTKSERERLEEIIEAVRLSEARKLYPRHLSGGMRSRVQLARALFASSAILFLDEAFSSLDEKLRLQANQLFRALQRRFGFTAVVVSHSIQEALYLGNRFLILEGVTREEPTLVRVGRTLGFQHSSDDVIEAEGFGRRVVELRSEFFEGVEAR